MKLNEDFYKESEGKTVYSQNISSKQLHIQRTCQRGLHQHKQAPEGFENRDLR